MVEFLPRFFFLFFIGPLMMCCKRVSHSVSVSFLLPGCGERAGGQYSTEAAAHQRSGTGSDPERCQTHRHPGTGARLGDNQPQMELTEQAGTAHDYAPAHATSPVLVLCLLLYGTLF